MNDVIRDEKVGERRWRGDRVRRSLRRMDLLRVVAVVVLLGAAACASTERVDPHGPRKPCDDVAMNDRSEWGPLAHLAGEWEGDRGLDVSFHNATGRVTETPFREQVTLVPFGPVANGTQRLYGLDYRMAAWRAGEADPFHTEVGYWLWDANGGHVLRCFMVPRGTTVLAGGNARPDDSAFHLEANVGSETYGILSNLYLAERARTTRYTCRVTTAQDVFSYDSTTTYVHATGGVIAHTDRNTLRRLRAP